MDLSTSGFPKDLIAVRKSRLLAVLKDGDSAVRPTPSVQVKTLGFAEKNRKIVKPDVQAVELFVSVEASKEPLPLRSSARRRHFEMQVTNLRRGSRPLVETAIRYRAAVYKTAARNGSLLGCGGHLDRRQLS